MKLPLQFMLLSLCTSIFMFAYHSAHALEEDAPREKVDFPETEIFLFDIDLTQSENVLSNGRNVTNRPGYDNQPYFTKDSQSFLFSRDDGYQTDVYEYFVGSDKIKRLTRSEATEFSPTPFPDNKSISFVSDRSASIWYANRTDLDKPKLAQAGNDNREPIGYYAWNHQTGDILYWSQYGFSVSLVNENSKDFHFISGHAVPSTPHIIPGTSNFSFVHRQTNGQVWIKQFDPSTKAVRPIVPLAGSNANYAWTASDTILLIENDTLHRWTVDSNQGWVPIADLTKFGIKGANRLAISPNSKKLAVVGLSAGE